MIRAVHVREELKEGAKKFEEAKSVEEKIAVVYKLITVVIKLALSTRDNTSSIMDKVGAERRLSKRRDENADKDASIETKVAPKKEKE